MNEINILIKNQDEYIKAIKKEIFNKTYDYIIVKELCLLMMEYTYSYDYFFLYIETTDNHGKVVDKNVEIKKVTFTELKKENCFQLIFNRKYYFEHNLYFCLKFQIFWFDRLINIFNVEENSSVSNQSYTIINDYVKLCPWTFLRDISHNLLKYPNRDIKNVKNDFIQKYMLDKTLMYDFKQNTYENCPYLFSIFFSKSFADL